MTKRILIFKLQIPCEELIEDLAARQGYVVTDIRPASGDETVVSPDGEVVLQESGWQIWLADVVAAERDL